MNKAEARKALQPIAESLRPLDLLEILSDIYSDHADNFSYESEDAKNFAYLAGLVTRARRDYYSLTELGHHTALTP